MADGYADVHGYCKSATVDKLREHGHVLMPGRYIGMEPHEDDAESFEDKTQRLAVEWREQREEAGRLDALIDHRFS
ncbi:MAG: hypothetical protein OXH99_14870 [Bryobacterales bacterium]|nr:hypothetical protein [Bryobacterales bacterium]